MNRLVVVSNRVPVPTGGNTQAGGLAVALDALMARRGGLWFGWSGKVAEDVSEPPRIRQHEQVSYATIDLTREEHDRYYNDFSNGVLWPLLHSMPALMHLDRQGLTTYRAVNGRIAGALMPMLQPNDVIWVHDYHLMALPSILRTRGVRAPIGFFLHVPFPAPDMLAAAPAAASLVRDLLAADLVGFQTSSDLEHFADAAQQLAGALRGSPTTLLLGSRRVQLGVFPVEIDSREFAATAEQAWRSPANERLRRSVQGQKLVLGVDRLDPTKGIPHRIAGFGRLLETRPDWRRRVTMLQIAALSRETVDAYRELREDVEREAGRINSDYSEPDWTPIRLMARAGARNTVAGYMREARVGLITPLRDGMNLVAKEYVAAQDPQNPGVLVLSRFAGAAHQFGAALLVNPHDTDELAESLDAALTMSLEERQDRWRACWRAIEDRSGLGWGRAFLAALLRTQTSRPAQSTHDQMTPQAKEPIQLAEPLPGAIEARAAAPVPGAGKPH